MVPVPSVAAFIASLPGSQFGSAPADLLVAALTDAAARTDSIVMLSPTQTELHVFYKAAILLCRHPYAMKMRNVDPAMGLTWERELKKLQRANTIGLRCW